MICLNDAGVGSGFLSAGLHATAGGVVPADPASPAPPLPADAPPAGAPAMEATLPAAPLVPPLGIRLPAPLIPLVPAEPWPLPPLAGGTLPPLPELGAMTGLSLCEVAGS